MLQGIRASTLTMPSFGHDMSAAGIPKVEAFPDTDSWSWSHPTNPHHSSYPTVFDPTMYANFTPQLQPPPPRTPSQSQPPSLSQPRHSALAASQYVQTATSTPPPPRPQVPANIVKAQPAFKPTWQGYLDTTKDAMTVVEAALQGRLNHISRRPHDKERAEMLKSGTVLVYEENASGIKRWTDAVHWSPSRVMNNCLIYRQLVRALKPEEKKTALNPSCGTKRKRKESVSPSITKTGEALPNSEDEFDNLAFETALGGDVDPMTKVYANYAQDLTPDQQRRFCGSLIDSYEFKEGGLMKKTISVKYQGTNHHVISYYSLEDVVNGKLKRPFQDARLADIQPRPDLLSGWKVSLEDEENKDLPLAASYSHHMQPSHLQHHLIGGPAQASSMHNASHSQSSLQLHVSDYWNQTPVPHYTASHSSAAQYASPQSATPQFPVSQPTPYTAQQSSPQTYVTPQLSLQGYAQPPSPQNYASPSTSSPQFSAPSTATRQYPTHQQSNRHYSFDQSRSSPAPQYHQPSSALQFSASPHPQVTHDSAYTLPQAATFDMHVPVSQAAPAQALGQPLQQHDHHRRASAPVGLQSFVQPQYTPSPTSQSYYVSDQKYNPPSHHGY